MKSKWTKSKNIKSKGDYISGKFLKGLSAQAKTHTVFSPADLTDKVFEFSSDPNHIEKALISAYKAYPSWSALTQPVRNQYLKKLAQIYKKRAEEIAILISRETGKPLWESRQEARALSQKIDITLNEALPLVQDTSFSPLRPGTLGKITYRSKGAFLVIGPFNFPAHLPNGHIVPALSTGNTVIFKPSEKTPAVAEKLAECFHQAGFPPGVFNLVQGPADIAQALTSAGSLAGVFFTGSYAVGRKIKKALLDQPQKILALEMGGKNHALIWKDADLKIAIRETLKGAYLTTGQRCSSTACLILHKEIKEKFLKEFIRLSQKIKIGHFRDNSLMGPLIDEKAVRRFKKALKEAKREKAFIHLLGGPIKGLNGHYVSPAVVEPKEYSPHSFYQNEELFLPFLSVYCVSKKAQALDLINQSAYGLSLSVFSEEEKFVKEILIKAQVGVFHWNLSSCSASSHLPFGGLKKSGNDRPTGLFAVHSCVTPVACLKKDFLTKTDDIKPFLKD